MILTLYRDKPDNCTMGNLYVDTVWNCFTLEPLEPIPAGTYPVTMEYWEKKNDYYPLLGEVPGHTGIYIHSGNVASDTRGCILVGLRQATDAILDSKLALTALRNVISSALEHEDVKIVIKEYENGT